jgi:hypothetical protein
MAMEIEFVDGRVGARADGRVSAVKPFTVPPKPRSRRDSDPGQGNLF